MTLAIASYASLPVYEDEKNLLNLAWTADEQAYLSADIVSIVAEELETEIRGRLPTVNHYAVRDPYGEGALGAAVGDFFELPRNRYQVTSGAGVTSLLHALVRLNGGGSVYVGSDVYPDFPHWTLLAGGICHRPSGTDGWRTYLHDVQLIGPRIILIDRPVMTGEDVSLVHLREICAAAERPGTLVLVDESNANYSPPSYSAVNLVPHARNLVVLRGLSKAYLLGGLRVAYCAASPWATARVRMVVPPLLASSLSLQIARKVLRLGDIARPLRDRIAQHRTKMVALLRSQLSVQTLPGSEYVPYLFCVGSARAAQKRIERLKIVGKSQVFWSREHRRFTKRYRLSVPLQGERWKRFEEKICAC